MPGKTETGRRNRWRSIGWSAAAALLVLPLIAMQVNDEFRWDAGDFLFLALIIGFVGGIVELTVRVTGSTAYRAAVAVALCAGALLIWINGAVGLIASEDNPANQLYAAVLAVAVAVAFATSFRAAGMMWAMAAAAAAQALVPGVVALTGWSTEPVNWPQVTGLTAFFVMLWAIAAGLFRRAAEDQEPR